MIHLVEMFDHALLNVTTALSKRTRNILNNLLAHFVVVNFAEEHARLFVIVVRVLVRVATRCSCHVFLFDCVNFVFDRLTSPRVGFIIGNASLRSVHIHGPIADVVGGISSAEGAVYGNLLVIGTQTVTVCVRVINETSLQHLVVRGLNSGNHMGRRKSNLLCFSMEIVWVPVEGQLAYFDERVIGVRPHLGDVVHVKAVVFGIGNGHDLHVPSPRGEILSDNGFKEVSRGKVLILYRHLGSLLSCKILDTLVSLEVVLH